MPALRARGADLERDFSFGVVLQLFEPLAGRRAVDRRGGAVEPLFAAGQAGEFPLLHGLHWLAANAAERDRCCSRSTTPTGPTSSLSSCSTCCSASTSCRSPGGADAAAGGELVRRIARHCMPPRGALRRSAPGRSRGSCAPSWEPTTSSPRRAPRRRPATRSTCASCRCAAGRRRGVVAEPSPRRSSSRIAALPGPAAVLASAVPCSATGPARARGGAGWRRRRSGRRRRRRTCAPRRSRRGAARLRAPARARRGLHRPAGGAARRVHARAAELLRERARAEQVASHLVHAHGAPRLAVGALPQAAPGGRARCAGGVGALPAEAVAAERGERGALLAGLALAEARRGRGGRPRARGDRGHAGARAGGGGARDRDGARGRASRRRPRSSSRPRGAGTEPAADELR